ncbi:fibronectin type III domain-containing protein [Paramicrobacterium fandaimingii]|uniref:fibronectin type III domain-containing protein n=1 Tax=Paramicrobacterium fandaimingii TaxID=2708079 RepID=UPI0014216540|nr:fibronectin type III domain-containing protein [Microbacterium fandaimingii]
MRPTRWTSTIALASLLTSGLIVTADSHEAEAVETSISITSPVDESTVSGETITVEGTFSNASELVLVVGAQELLPIETVGQQGTWTVDLDISDRDGRLDLAVRGRDLTTMYTTWSPFLVVDVDNPSESRPVVTIVSPSEGDLDSRVLRVVVNVESEHAVERVEVRVNGSKWRRAHGLPRSPGEYRATFPAARIDFASIEARAVSANGHSDESSTTYVALRGTQTEAPETYEQDRAMWVWERASYEAVFNEDARDRLGAVMDDTETFNSDPIRTIYLGVGSYGDKDMLRDSRDEVADFVAWAKDRGYHVQATVAGGTQPPYLGALEQFQHFAVAEFEKVLNYNLAVPEKARFDGINVDIEPYILSEWKVPGNDLAVRWLKVLQTLIERRDASGLPVLVGPAIPRWLDTSSCCTAITWQDETKPLSDHIQDMTDYISIMDYRDTAEGSAGIIAQAQHEIDYANQIGKPNSVVLGVESKDLSGGGDPETVTFWEEGRTYMEAELDKVYAAFGESSAFGGIAMHHYDDLLIFPSAWEDAPPVYYPVPGAGPGGPEMPK